MNSVAPTNGWTGGQYSLYRVVFGACLLVHFLRLMPWSTEMDFGGGVITLSVGAIASVAFAIGWFDRTAAVVMVGSSAFLVGYDLVSIDPSLFFLRGALLAHVFLPKGPYGSWSVRGRVDPDGGWRMPPSIHRAAWIVMALGYAYSGIDKLVSTAPLGEPVGLIWGVLVFELLFAPLVLVHRLRPWLWLGMLLTQLSLMVWNESVGLGLGIVVLHLFTFDPRWVRPSGIDEKVTLFYDGTCGLCHRCVRFVLAEDHTGASCDLAPLQGESLERAVPNAGSLPDSIVLRLADGTLLVRSAAVLHIMRRLGGAWRVIALVSGLVPRVILDVGYRGVARIRRRLFRRPEALCPIVPAHLARRFVAD